MVVGIRESKCSDGSCLIAIEGKFDINVQSEFRNAYKKRDRSDTFVIDLQECDYLDSSAMGMLLQIREFAENRKDHVILKNCSRRVRDILSVAKMCALFTLE
jgi:anti-anti-sigma factor